MFFTFLCLFSLGMNPPFFRLVIFHLDKDSLGFITWTFLFEVSSILFTQLSRFSFVKFLISIHVVTVVYLLELFLSLKKKCCFLVYLYDRNFSCFLIHVLSLPPELSSSLCRLLSHLNFCLIISNKLDFSSFFFLTIFDCQSLWTPSVSYRSMYFALSVFFSSLYFTVFL